MKRLWMLASGVLLSGLLVATAMAAETGEATAPQQVLKKGKEARRGGGAAVSKVPQAQIDTVKKREAVKKRRDELLKMRARNAAAK